METATEQKAIHAFEAAGLGKAPFRYVGVEHQEMAYGERVLGTIGGATITTKPGGTCAYCGTYIVNMFRVCSDDGHEFHVGCDCIKKVGDVGLISEVARVLSANRKIKARATREDKWAAGQPARDRRSRILNIIANERHWAKLRRAAKNAADNKWLIEVLDGMPGDFVQSMIESLGRSKVSDLSDRCVTILRDIYGKAMGGRRNSKAYDAAVEVFDEKAVV